MVIPTSPAQTVSFIVPSDARAAIEAVILNDEGGWVLSSDPDGGDGGWTYAGITSKTWSITYPDQRNKATIKTMIEEDVEAVKIKVFEIYYKQYYTLLITFDSSIRAMELSCAINCGPSVARTIVFSSKNKLEFAHNWLLHYGSIVRDNPAKAQFIRGWINRVFKYLTPSDVPTDSPIDKLVA